MNKLKRDVAKALIYPEAVPALRKRMGLRGTLDIADLPADAIIGWTILSMVDQGKPYDPISVEAKVTEEGLPCLGGWRNHILDLLEMA